MQKRVGPTCTSTDWMCSDSPSLHSHSYGGYFYDSSP